MILTDLVRKAADENPDRAAVEAAGGTLTYGDLRKQASRLARGLKELGVRPMDRVGIWLEKAPPAAVALQAVLQAGAAYVPVDPMSPLARAAHLLADCEVKAVVTTAERGRRLRDVGIGAGLVVVDEPPDVPGPVLAWSQLDSLPEADPAVARPGDLAYILYTSGSTGKPKGVCISHENALAFVRWGANVCGLGPDDRLSNHAPLHFDLSVFDLYGAYWAGACVCLVPEGLSYAPARLWSFLCDRRISVWYSVPSALVLMMEQSELLTRPRPENLRVVLFAGEVFPIVALKTLRRHWSDVRFLNWYGPTETNVCTSYEVGEIPEDQETPVPIGTAASGDRVWAVGADGSEVGDGEEGELLVEGPTVMMGYWGRPRQEGPYRTGDIVKRRPDGSYLYVGRRDHMVKVRGHRIELGEIEAALATHPEVREAAVVVRGAGPAARLVAFVAGRGESAPSLLNLKRHLADRVPRYMIIDRLQVVSALPRTRNGKVDRVALAGES